MNKSKTVRGTLTCVAGYLQGLANSFEAINESNIQHKLLAPGIRDAAAQLIIACKTLDNYSMAEMLAEEPSISHNELRDIFKVCYGSPINLSDEEDNAWALVWNVLEKLKYKITS